MVGTEIKQKKVLQVRFNLKHTSFANLFTVLYEFKCTIMHLADAFI